MIRGGITLSPIPGIVSHHRPVVVARHQPLITGSIAVAREHTPAIGRHLCEPIGRVVLVVLPASIGRLPAGQIARRVIAVTRSRDPVGERLILRVGEAEGAAAGITRVDDGTTVVKALCLTVQVFSSVYDTGVASAAV